MDIELWKDVAGYDGDYQVSNLGRVKSLKRGPEHPRVLRPNTNSRGYRYVVLCRDGCTKTMQVHRLVATTFIENPDGLPQVNHKDGNKQNNSASNLEWVTAAGNTQHAARTGLLVAILSPHDAAEIKKIILEGSKTQTEIAKMYGVSQVQVSRIARGESWNYVPEVANINVPPHPTGGRFQPGHISGVSKLSGVQVAEIRAALAAGESLRSIGRRYLIHPSTIWAIKSGKTWGDAA